MAVPDWPTTLPTALLLSGYSQSLANVTLRTKMDVGPAKVRRRSSAGIEPVNGKIVLNKTELGYLRTFHDDTLLGGSLRFAWKEPITAAAVEFRFVSPPTWTTLDGGLYSVSLELEILP